MDSQLFRLTGLFIMLSLVLYSCQPATEAPQESIPHLQTDLANPCVKGSVNEFPLEQIPSTIGDYGFKLSDNYPVVNGNDCVCEATQYIIEFALPIPPGQIQVLDQNSMPLPYYLETDLEQNLFRLVVPAGELNDGAFEIHVDFEVKAAEFKYAGGLCIIDNIGGIQGTDPNQAAFQLPYVPVHNPPAAPEILVIVPADRTIPVGYR